MVSKVKRFIYLIAAVFLLLTALAPAQIVSAQDYRFSLPTHEVEAYIEADGSVTLYYYMVFDNAPGAHAIDFIDLGLPKAQVDMNRIEADVNDSPITAIKASSYVSGAAELGLGSKAIPPGQSGTVRVYVRQIQGMLYNYDQSDRSDYVNFQFTPNYFGSQYDQSRNTKYRMTIILPPGVGAQDGVYYEPSSWPGSNTPEASLTTDNRVYYSWYTENADVHTSYLFGAAFPASAVSSTAIASGSTSSGSSSGSSSGFDWSKLRSSLTCLLIGGGFVLAFVLSLIRKSKANSARKMQYMPPKIAIEGQGIKRGLTAVEAALLLELPMDRVLTMILFGLLKKEAVTIITQDPLELKANDPLPAGLYDYETAFIKAYASPNLDRKRQRLTSMTIDLVKSVADKMQGFSKVETKAYYQDIINRAWAAVENAKTPEVKSAQYNENLEWTMMDGEFNEKTERTFTGQPVFIPRWWPRYDPVYREAMGRPMNMSPAPAQVGPSMQGAGSKGGSPTLSLPNIPGSDFAAKMVTGASNMAASTIGNVATFTGGVTRMTNPIPVQPARRSSGGGGFRGGGGGGCVSCACACACAGCACACAGGGR